MEDLELDDHVAFDSAPAGVDPRDVIWVLFVLQGSVYVCMFVVSAHL